MSTVRSTAIAAGHTVESNEALTAANLANDTHLIIGEPSVVPTAGELADLASWVTGGGILMLFADSGGSAIPGLNSIAAGIGSSLFWSGSISSTPILTGGNFATAGAPYNLVGLPLSTTPGTPVIAGGTALAGNYLRYEQFGAGYIFAFADRVDHNFFSPTAANVNGKLFLNILNHTEAPAVPDVGATLPLLGLALVGLATVRRSARS